MTGKELYDWVKQGIEDGNLSVPVLYWEFLTPAEQRVWNRKAEEAGK